MKRRIAVSTLVIDDDVEVCRKLESWLAAAAYEVVTFVDPRRGLEHARRRPCDVALVDLRLPDMDGTRVIAHLCEASPRTRVIAMSAFPDARQRDRAREAGAQELIEKPVRQELVLASLSRQLDALGVPGRTEHAFNVRLGARLRSLRKRQRRTQQELAEACGITAAQLSQIELGKTATSTWTLARICGALKLSLVEFFGEL